MKPLVLNMLLNSYTEYLYNFREYDAANQMTLCFKVLCSINLGCDL